MKKLLAFDLDDTLSIAKTPISDRIAELLGETLDQFDVCIISGCTFDQFGVQVLDQLDASPQRLRRLHIMPTCGTRYYRYNEVAKEWQLQYTDDLTAPQKKKIFAVLESAAREAGLWEENPAGDILEDRLSQVTYSALGQRAKSEDKYAWDPDGAKRLAIRAIAAPQLPDFEIRLGGTTSIDITKPGIDKAYGMQKLIDILDISRDDILFFGDKLGEGGNDYPIRAMGVDALEVSEWQDTAARLETILAVLR